MRGFVSSPAYRAVATVLAKVRNDAGVSQRELAKRVGTLPSVIAKMETGSRRVDVLELIQIAQALGLRPEEVFDDARRAVSDAEHSREGR